MTVGKTGVLLINLGTPDSPSVKDVRKYLFQFLNDPRVIDINPIARFFLVNFVIVPFRAPKSARIYKQLWTENGSPLLFHGKNLAKKLQAELGEEYHVELAMRYQSPSIDSAMEKLQKLKLKKLIVFPLYPQYASSSSGSSIEKVLSILKTWWVIPETKIISDFYNNQGYIKSFAENGMKYNPDIYDHVLFSYHGLPVRQVNKAHKAEGDCEKNKCELTVNEENRHCYKAQCYETTRLIANELKIPKEKYSVAFQSRLTKEPWLEPFSDVVVADKAKEGVKSLLVFSPAFVADCLETTIEIGHEYNEIFKENGGQKLQLVESLNDNDNWVKSLQKILSNK
jgi:protoporphyrin/coproporphyrin ferrochelatase